MTGAKQLSGGLSEKAYGVHEFSVTARAAADGQTVAELQLQPGGWVSVVVRDGRPLSPENATRLAAGDHVFVLADPRPPRTTGAAVHRPRLTGRAPTAAAAI